jgi:hypothetical protein
MQAGKNKENIMLTVDCFKSLCMLANSEMGKKTKRYYLDLEKIFKRCIVLEVNEQLQLKDEEIDMEKSEKIKFQNLYTFILSNAKRHHFYKFSVKGPCLYVIIQGIDYIIFINKILNTTVFKIFNYGLKNHNYI